MDRETGSRAGVSRRAGVVRLLAFDLVGPLVVFQVCRNAGVPEVWSLVIAGSLPAIGVVSDWLRWRTYEVVALVVLGGIALSIVLALISSDPRAVLLEGAIITGVFGIACLASLKLRRPLLFYFGQAFYGGKHSADGLTMDEDFGRYAEARSFWRIVTTAWGVSHIVLAIALIVVVTTQSTATALTVNRTVPWAVNGVLLAWSIWWGERLRARKPVDEPDSG